MSFKTKGINQNYIKMIAITTMFIDHLGATIMENAYSAYHAQGFINIGNMSIDIEVIRVIDLIMRFIGRIAFPIFCFAIVEGFCYTKNVWKYIARLAVFAVVAEIPFDLAFSKSICTWNYQNVLVTMLIGLLTLVAISFFEQRVGKHTKNPGTEKQLINVILQIASLAAGISLAELCNTDYSGSGILCIVVMYYLRMKKNRSAVLASFFGSILISVPNFGKYIEFCEEVLSQNLKEIKVSPYAPTIVIFGILFPILIAFVIYRISKLQKRDAKALTGGIAILTFHNGIEVFALLGIIPMSQYTGERGKKSKFLQYFFYIFYPLHISLLYLLGVALKLYRLSWNM